MQEESPRRDRTINYIEFSVGDVARSKAFYGKAFGWEFTDYGPNYAEFASGELRGGFAGSETVTPGGPMVVLYGDDLDDVMAGIKAAGGTITKPTYEFPGGERFHFTDPDGYELAVWREN